MSNIVKIPESHAREILCLVGFQEDLMDSAIFTLKEANLIEQSALQRAREIKQKGYRHAVTIDIQDFRDLSDLYEQHIKELEAK